VDLGHCKTAKRVPCGHSPDCKSNFVDHAGMWYAREGYDSVFVPDNSKPATSTKEWCVVDVSRIKVLSGTIHRFSKDERVSKS
jgi:hypothetical protein